MSSNVLIGVARVIWLFMKHNGECQGGILGPEIQRRKTFFLSSKIYTVGMWAPISVIYLFRICDNLCLFLSSKISLAMLQSANSDYSDIITYIYT